MESFLPRGTGVERGTSGKVVSKMSAKECAGSVESRRTGRRDFVAARTAKAEASVVLPTPPLPMKNESSTTPPHCNSRRSANLRALWDVSSRSYNLHIAAYQ